MLIIGKHIIGEEVAYSEDSFCIVQFFKTFTFFKKKKIHPICKLIIFQRYFLFTYSFSKIKPCWISVHLNIKTCEKYRPWGFLGASSFTTHFIYLLICLIKKQNNFINWINDSFFLEPWTTKHLPVKMTR